MGPIDVRRLLQRHRRHWAVLVALVAVTCAVAAHHALPTMADDGHHMDGTAQQAMEMCLAALTAVGATIAVVAIGLVLLPRRRLAVLTAVAGLPTPRVAWPRARAGPALLTLLCVSRR